MNRRITDYKIQKFDNIVNFLKEQYKDNEEILKQLNSLSLYNDKIFNDSGYYKVIRIFNDFLKTVDRKKLYEAWHANQSGSYRKSQIENWKKVLDFIKSDEDLKVLYNDNLKD
jgi:hypothetical protein